MNRFVFVIFTFPILPLPFPLSGICLLLLPYMLSPCGDTHFHGQQQWKPMSAQSSPGSILLLCPAPHFHYSSKGLFVLSWLSSPLDPVRSDKKVSFCLVSPMWLPTHIPTIIFLPQTLWRHTCARRRRESPHFQERQRKLSI